MISRLGEILNRWSRRWVPDPFVLALALTLVVIAVALARLIAAGAGAGDAAGTVLHGWFDGFRGDGGLAFALKMALILVTGHALALSPPVQRALARIARVPDSAASATALVAVVSCVAALIHWGLGAVAGALLAREIGRHASARGLTLHYPLLGAAAYGGFVVWHGGLTGSAPTEVARGNHLMSHLVGTVPMSETIFSPLNLVVTASLVALVALLFRALVPRDPAAFVPPDPAQLAPLPARGRAAGASEAASGAPSAPGAIDWLQDSPWPGAVLGGACTVFVVWAMIAGWLGVHLDSVVLLFLFLSLALQGSLRCYVEAIAEGARGAGAIILQFPFYFAILGVMKSSGMVQWISDGLVALSTENSFPVWAYLSAGVVNLFVPSGGGQWAVQGEILLQAGGASGVEPSTTIMAFAYGDAWTNTLQPFWALPLLGIMGLRARDIIGYTAVLFLAMGALVPALLLVLG